MKITNQTQYTVWVRPPGSHLWTINMKPTPFWSSRRMANNLASKLAIETGRCAVVRELEFPGEPDPELSAPYIEIIDEQGFLQCLDRSAAFIPPAERDEIGDAMREEGLDNERS